MEQIPTSRISSLPSLEILQVDIDDDTKTPQRFAVMSLPTLILFRGGHEVARLDGLIRDEDLERALEEDKEE